MRFVIQMNDSVSTITVKNIKYNLGTTLLQLFSSQTEIFISKQDSAASHHY